LCVQGELQELHAEVDKQKGEVARLEASSEQVKLQAEAAKSELEHRFAEAAQQLEVFKQRAELAERVGCKLASVTFRGKEGTGALSVLNWQGAEMALGWCPY
jgi:predicted  nucleic acid-binding Zn-ribbon protein